MLFCHVFDQARGARTIDPSSSSKPVYQARQHNILLLPLVLDYSGHSNPVVAFLVVDIACLAVVHSILVVADSILLEVVRTGCCKGFRTDHSLEEGHIDPAAGILVGCMASRDRHRNVAVLEVAT